MRRRLLPLAAVVTAALVAALFQVPAALAGGYCHTPLTDAAGTTVTMQEYCYSPRVLRVPVGAKVTFVNRDPVAHPTVASGAELLFEGTAGSSGTATFDRPGIFPYFCHEHIGMIGVVVVGNGKASATAAGSVQASDPPAAKSAAQPVAATSASATRRAPWSAAAALVAALVVVTAATVVARRRRPRTTGAAPQA